MGCLLGRIVGKGVTVVLVHSILRVLVQLPRYNIGSAHFILLTTTPTLHPSYLDPHLCRELVIATHLLRSRYVQRCGMNRYIHYHVSVYTFSYQAVVPTGAYYLMVSTLCMNPQLLPISHGATLTYLQYCRVWP